MAAQPSREGSLLHQRPPPPLTALPPKKSPGAVAVMRTGHQPSRFRRFEANASVHADKPWRAQLPRELCSPRRDLC